MKRISGDRRIARVGGLRRRCCSAMTQAEIVIDREISYRRRSDVVACELSMRIDPPR
jgi:hypothetical protein